MYDFSYTTKMPNTFSEFLLDQPWMKLIYALSVSSRPRSLRELADMTGLSVSTVQDLVRRLKAAKIISSKPVANKIFYSLEINNEEEELIQEIIKAATQEKTRKLAKKYSLRSEKVINWIDETIETLQIGKKRLHDTN